MEYKGNIPTTEQTPEQRFYNDPPMGAIESRVNKLTQRDTSFLTTHVEQLALITSKLERAELQYGNQLARLRGHQPETVGSDHRTDTDTYVGNMSNLISRLNDVADLLNSDADELNGYI